MQAQAETRYDAVRLVTYDDGMSSVIYAYVRVEGGIIKGIDDEGITFTDRDPSLVWACVSGDLVVVYRYDTGLLGENNTVRVRYRFDGQPASPTQSWPMQDVLTAAQTEMALSMMAGGADSAEIQSNPFYQAMMAGASLGAQMPAESTEEFLAAARSAESVMFRVTDPIDGETFTDVFRLSGFAEVLEALKSACPP